MVYGRLDVFWPDGQFQSFPLVETNVSIGRSPGNTITLDTDTISRYHFSISHKDNEVRLADMDSVNGTYIDGVKLRKNEVKVLQGGEEILIGHLRIIYYEMDEMPTQPTVTVSDDTTQRVFIEDKPFTINVQPPPIAIPPGAHASAELTVVNSSDEECWYQIEVTGVPAGWIRVDRPKIMLEAHQSGQVVINFKPARRSDTEPKEYPVTIRVREESSIGNALEATTNLRVLPYSGFGMALERHLFKGQDRFRLHVHNQGSAPLPLTVSGGSLNQAVIVQPTPTPAVTLAPGQRVVIQGDIRAKSPHLFGKSVKHPVDIVVRSGDDAAFVAATRGVYVQNALLPGWAPYAVAAVFATVAVVFVATLLLLSTPEPAIAEFSVETTRVARGQSLAVSWAVTDVAEVRIAVDGTPVWTSMTADTSMTLLDTSNLADSAIVSIAGINGNRVVNQEQFIQVYDPLQLIAFNADPTRLVRYTVEELSLDWNVQNAEFVQIGGIEALTGLPLDQQFDPVGSVSGLVGIPDADVDLTVYAEDANGNALNQSIRIEVIDPLCSASSAPVTLYDGPTEQNQVVGTLPEDTPVVVDGRSESGAWVRVRLTGDIRGWGPANELLCNDTFEMQSLQVIVDLIPPPASPTPIPTVTPTMQPTPTPSG